MAQIKDIMQTKASILRSYTSQISTTTALIVHNSRSRTIYGLLESILKMSNSIQVFLRLKESERPVVYANYSVSIINAKNEFINEFID